MTTAELERSVYSLIRAAMEKIEVPEPNAVAALVARDLDAEQLHQFAIRGIAERVRQMTFRERTGKMPPGSARWGAVAEQNRSGELDLARFSIWTGVEHQWLLDADAIALDMAVVQHLEMAKGHEHSADQLAQLAAILRRRKRGTVRDLPEKTVREVFNA